MSSLLWSRTSLSGSFPDGPFAETKGQFLGFYVAEFASLEEATALSQSIASPSVTL